MENNWTKITEPFYARATMNTAPLGKGDVWVISKKDFNEYAEIIETLFPSRLSEEEIEEVLLEVGITGDTTRRCLVLAISNKIQKPLPAQKEIDLSKVDKHDTIKLAEYINDLYGHIERLWKEIQTLNSLRRE